MPKGEMKELSEAEIVALWNMIFNISIHMLHDKNEAEDAVQKIFMKLIEKSESFRKESQYKTWAYRVAYNFLIDEIRKKKLQEIPFDDFEKDINNEGLYNNDLSLDPVELKLYTDQIKAGCSLAMLQCLKPEQRHIYILGEIFQFPGKVASEICGISSEAYRKTLSRSKRKIQDFVRGICGQVNASATCHCEKRIHIAKQRGHLTSVDSQKTLSEKTIAEVTGEMESLEDVSQLFRSNMYQDLSDLYFSRMKQRVSILREKI